MIVVDNSVILPLFIEDEDSSAMEELVSRATPESLLLVPRLWVSEFGNGLRLISLRRVVAAQVKECFGGSGGGHGLSVNGRAAGMQREVFAVLCWLCFVACARVFFWLDIVCQLRPLFSDARRRLRIPSERSTAFAGWFDLRQYAVAFVGVSNVWQCAASSRW